MVKRKTVIIISFVLVLFGCQQTPDRPNIVYKGGDDLQNIILSSPAPEQHIVTEARWTEEYNITNLECIIDAPIVIPDASHFPVYKVKRHPFDADRADSIVKYFAKHVTGYHISFQTKEEIEEELISAKRGWYNVDDDGERWERYDGQDMVIAELEERLKNAPTEVFEPITDDPITLPFDNTYLLADGSKVYIGAKNHHLFYYADNNNTLMQPESWIIGGGARPGEPAGTTLKNVKISENDARQKVNALISDLKIHNFGIAEAEKARIDHVYTCTTISEGWCITLSRNDGNSIAVNLFSADLNGILDFESEDYVERWFPERIIIYVDETGIRSFYWSYPLDVVEVMNANVALLPFDEIKEWIRKYIKYGYNQRLERDQAEYVCQITVDKIVLSNVLVPIKDDLDHQMLVPAWLVYYSQEFPNTKIISVFAVNAIDGSIIDLCMRSKYAGLIE